MTIPKVIQPFEPTGFASTADGSPTVLYKDHTGFASTADGNPTI